VAIFLCLWPIRAGVWSAPPQWYSSRIVRIDLSRSRVMEHR
jgi:hypothetical protein